jgi:hypothetical protein
LHGPKAASGFIVGGDLVGDLSLWQWGGVAGEVAILLFLVASATAIIGGRDSRAPTRAASRSRLRGNSTLAQR